MRSLALALALTVLCAGTAAAQKKPDPNANPNPRQGFWIGFGLGAGAGEADCADCDGFRAGGVAWYLRLGGTLSRHLLLGAETNGWGEAGSETSWGHSMAFGSVVLLWYPSATGAFHLKFGVGGMRYTADVQAGKITATAGSALLGLGYELRLRRMMSLNVFVEGLASTAAKFKLNGVSPPPGEEFNFNLYQFGVGLTWH